MAGRVCAYCENPLEEGATHWFCSDMCLLKTVIRKAIAEDDARKHGIDEKMADKLVQWEAALKGLEPRAKPVSDRHRIL